MPEEFQDDKIQEILKGYKGKELTLNSEQMFENSISNIKANMTAGSFENGFRYSIVKKPLKGGKVLATFRISIADEKTLFGKTMTASLMADMLKAGTKSMSKEQIKDRLDELKSSISFFWYGQTLTISINSYEKELAEAMDILRQCLTESVFPENELTIIKTENKTWLESQMKDPQSVAYFALNRKLNQQPYGHIIYNYSPQEEIDEQTKVTRQQIVDFYNTYMGASNGYGTLLGNVDAMQATGLLKNVFASWKSPKPFTRFIPTYQPNATHYERINTPDKENGALYCGINIKISKMDADYPALLMANEMLGSGGFLTSRIPTRLREKEGISYGAGSFLSIPIDNDAGEWGAYAFYNPNAVNRVDSVMHDEIVKALKQGFTEEELKQSIVSWKNERQTSLGYDNFIISLINDAMRSGVSIDEFDALEKKVEKLTVEQVNAALRKYIDPSRICYVFAGDFEKGKK
jgi:zinc protease